MRLTEKIEKGCYEDLCPNDYQVKEQGYETLENDTKNAIDKLGQLEDTMDEFGIMDADDLGQVLKAFRIITRAVIDGEMRETILTSSDEEIEKDYFLTDEMHRYGMGIDEWKLVAKTLKRILE